MCKNTNIQKCCRNFHNTVARSSGAMLCCAGLSNWITYHSCPFYICVPLTFKPLVVTIAADLGTVHFVVGKWIPKHAYNQISNQITHYMKFHMTFPFPFQNKKWLLELQTRMEEKRAENGLFPWSLFIFIPLNLLSPPATWKKIQE